MFECEVLADSIGPTGKECRRCRKTKACDSFGPCKAARDGLSYWCRPCRAAYEDSRRTAPKKMRRDPSLLSRGKKVCCACHEQLLLEDFSPALRGYGGRAAFCRVCFSARNRAVRNKNGTHAAYIRKWRMDNADYRSRHAAHQASRRALKAKAWDGSDLTIYIKFLYEDELICFYCRQITWRDQRTIDHVVPLSRGGKHEANNLVMACGTCNSRKGAMNYYEYTKRMDCES